MTLVWSPIEAGPVGADWQALLHLPLDPYLLWADVTGFAGYVPGDEGDLAQIAFEIVRPQQRQLSAPFDYARHIVDLGATSVYVADIPISDIGVLLQMEGLVRLELGLPVRAPLSGLTRVPGEEAKPTRVSDPVVAVIDYGCAFSHEAFRRRADDGWHTRIRYLWDQDGRHRPRADSPPPWRPVYRRQYGWEMPGSEIDKLIRRCTTAQGLVDEDACYRRADRKGEQFSYSDSVRRDLAHGTHVLDLAAGRSPLSPKGDPAEDAQIIFVQLPRVAAADTSGGSMVVHVLDAVRYILDRVEENADLVVNLSYGSMAGPHDGSTILEQALDSLIQEASESRNFALILPAGNSLLMKDHVQFTLSADQPSRRLQWRVLSDDPTDSFLEIWYPRDCTGLVRITLTPPDGPPFTGEVGSATALQDESGRTGAALIHLAQASAGADDAMVLIAVAPTASFDGRPLARSGIWTVDMEVVGSEPREVPVLAWVERDDPWLGTGWAPRQSRFLSPLLGDEPPCEGDGVSRRTTTNSLANGCYSVVVGGCYGDRDRLAAYSSSGPTRNPWRPTPWPNVVETCEDDLVTFGVLAAGSRSGVKVRMNGTSVAAAQITRWIFNHFSSATSMKPQMPGWKGVLQPGDKERVGEGRAPRAPTTTTGAAAGAPARAPSPPSGGAPPGANPS